MDTMSPSLLWWLLPHVLECALRTSTAVFGTLFLALAWGVSRMHTESALHCSTQCRVCAQASVMHVLKHKLLCCVRRSCKRVLKANGSLAVGHAIASCPH